MKDLSSYRFVVIDSFYDTVNDSDAREWLGKLFQFKVNSYRGSYPYGIMPFGSTDLIGANWILCRESGSTLVPIMGLKTIESKRTEKFRMDFPAFAMLSEPGHVLHREAIQHELTKASSTKRGLGFVGSWTIDPIIRRDASLSDFCRKVTSAFISYWVDVYDIQSAIAFAILKFHVDEFHSYLGMTSLLTPEGKPLPHFNPAATFGELTRVSILRRKSQSIACIQDAKDLASLWERRIIIASPDSPLKQNDTYDQAA